MNATDAVQFGLPSSYSCASSGDMTTGITPNNGVIDGCYWPTSPDGEANLFWQQLGAAGLIDGTYSLLNTYSNGITNVYGADVGKYFPHSKMGGDSSYVYVWANGPSTCCPTPAYNKKNYFGIGTIAQVLYGLNITLTSTSLTPLEAYTIDLKIDDGLPQQGRTTATGVFASNYGGSWVGTQTTAATPRNSSTCYDNNNIGGATQQYSVGQDGGNNITCAISMVFQ